MKKVNFEAARTEAEIELQSTGYVRTSVGEWEGGTDLPKDMSLRVLLPLAFPYELPQVFLVDRQLPPRQLPHVERNQKICIARSGTIVDSSRPVAILRDAIARAKSVIKEGLEGPISSELQLEFDAYWPSKGAATCLSFCEVGGASREIAAAMPRTGGKRSLVVVAESRRLLRAILDRASVGPVEDMEIGDAWFVQLRSPIDPPPFEQEDELRYVDDVLSNHVDPNDARAIRERRLRAQTWLCFVFAFQLKSGEQVVFGVRTRRLLPPVRGYRVGHAKLGTVLNQLAAEPLERLCTSRADGRFVRRRTGSPLELGKRVLLVGCGSVGSHVALDLMGGGLANLLIVDPEKFAIENVGRHVLPMQSVGMPKADAVRDMIHARHPQAKIESTQRTIQDLVLKDPEIGKRFDLVVFATGDLSLELRMSELIRRHVAIAHVWLEAHGVGGHVLLDLGNGPGCLGCVLVEDPVFGVICKASLYAPGQTFVETLGGCGGSFTPFSLLDAQRAALEGTRVVFRALAGEISAPTLVTWFEPNPSFERSGLVLSARARHLLPGGKTETTEHAGCERCAA